MCRNLAALDLPDTRIALAEFVPAGGFAPPADAEQPGGQPAPTYDQLPAFCRVAATISPVPDSEIKFEVWMPAENWNGKFAGTGNGGLSGEIWHPSMSEPVARGYAVANTDTGHGGGGADASFAIGHPEKLVDFAWRAVHEMTVKSKAIVAEHYGTQARLAYWVGCSTGGRQGLKEAQRFPGDYDAVFAAAPANNWIPTLTISLVMQQTLSDTAAGFPPDKLSLLREGAIAACDAQDGIVDRVALEPQTCGFDPAALECAPGDTGECLLPSEVEAARNIYRGVVNPRTGKQIFPGPFPGSENQWAAFTPGRFPIGLNYWRDIIVGDPDWDPSAIDLSTDVERAIARDTAEVAAMDPDLSKFVARRGKLLLWHGWTDGMISPQNSINYYNEVLAALGASQARDSVRLFLAPGVGHCGGGEGPSKIDTLSVLEAWVENGVTPKRIIASKSLENGDTRTRPLCPYPLVAHYDGTGSTDDAENFECGPATLR
jgi:feruloyl esterase